MATAMPYHFVARGADHLLLFRTNAEAAYLWDCVVNALPGPIALCLMPDHLHALHPHDLHVRLGAALSGYARWRNARRGDRGRVFDPLPPPEPLVDDEDKLRRSIRYIHLNPVRAGLVSDPLAWAFSTHRDRVGLASNPATRPHPDPEWLHSYVSSDPSCRVEGTPLPGLTLSTPDLLAVWHATSAVTRCSLSRLSERGPARRLFVAAAVELCEGSTRSQIGKLAGVDERSVRRFAHARDPLVRVVARALHDPRFAPLVDGDLRQQPGWGRYRRRG